MREGLCSHCKQWLPLDKDGLVPYHDWPPPTRQVCKGAKLPPVDVRAAITFDEVTKWRKSNKGTDGLPHNAALYLDWLIREVEFAHKAIHHLMHGRTTNAKRFTERMGVDFDGTD